MVSLACALLADVASVARREVGERGRVRMVCPPAMAVLLLRDAVGEFVRLGLV